MYWHFFFVTFAVYIMDQLLKPSNVLYFVFFITLLIVSRQKSVFYGPWSYYKTCKPFSVFPFYGIFDKSYNDHIDRRFAKSGCRATLTNQEYIQTSIRLLDGLRSMTTEVPFVLCYGALIGYYMNRQFLPWDTDIDMLVIGDDNISKLVKYHGWETEDFLFEVHPHVYRRKTYQTWWSNLTSNFIDARFICKQTGMYIDFLFHYLDPTTHTYKARDYNEYTSDDLLPLQNATFYNRPVWLPHRIERVLAKRYGPTLTFKNYNLNSHGQWISTPNSNLDVHLN
jgi:hypothetical protein